MIRIGVIGYGYWGPNLLRNFSEVSKCQVTAVSDLRSERLSLVRLRHPTIKVMQDYNEILKDRTIDAVCVATPISTHYKIAMEALRAGKHLLVAKPLAATYDEALLLAREARKRKRILMVEHTFIYTGSVQKIHELIKEKKLGDIYYYDSTRVNLGLFQHDVNVIWDLAVHDVSIMDYVLTEQPYAVSATGISHISDQPENIAYITLFFKNHLIAHINVNWLAPVKVRRILIGGSKKMIVYDDIEPSEKVKVYDKGINVSSDSSSIYKMLVSYRTGDMWVPKLDITEALFTEANHFIHCIEKKKEPLTDADSGVRIVRILEAITRSMARNGQPVSLGTIRSAG